MKNHLRIGNITYDNFQRGAQMDSLLKIILNLKKNELYRQLVRIFIVIWNSQSISLLRRNQDMHENVQTLTVSVIANQ